MFYLPDKLDQKPDRKRGKMLAFVRKQIRVDKGHKYNYNYRRSIMGLI